MREASLINAWVADLKAGNEDAAKSLYLQYSKAMYNLLCRLCGDSELAKDLMQDAFIEAFNKIDSFKGEATFGAWLKRIVLNTGLQYIRKKRLDYDELTPNIDHTDDEGCEAFYYNEYEIHYAIKSLPDKCRNVVVLYLLENYSHKEIAAQLGVTESTSKTHYKRGKALLKKQLKLLMNER